MLVSTKGRYALRVMIDLAEQADGQRIKLQDIANRQEISEKYLEGIISVLSKEGFVHAARGKGGGYCLSRPATEYTACEIIEAAEGPLVPIACLETQENACPRHTICKTLPMWAQLGGMISRYLQHITLQDLVDGALPAVNE